MSVQPTQFRSHCGEADRLDGITRALAGDRAETGRNPLINTEDTDFEPLIDAD